MWWSARVGATIPPWLRPSDPRRLSRGWIGNHRRLLVRTCDGINAMHRDRETTNGIVAAPSAGAMKSARERCTPVRCSVCCRKNSKSPSPVDPSLANTVTVSEPFAPPGKCRVRPAFRCVLRLFPRVEQGLSIPEQRRCFFAHDLVLQDAREWTGQPPGTEKRRPIDECAERGRKVSHGLNTPCARYRDFAELG